MRQYTGNPPAMAQRSKAQTSTRSATSFNADAPENEPKPTTRRHLTPTMIDLRLVEQLPVNAAKLHAATQVDHQK